MSVTEVMWLLPPTNSLADNTNRLPDLVALVKLAVRVVAVPDSVAPVDCTSWGWDPAGVVTGSAALAGDRLPAPSTASTVYW